jgi:hypothetical protein
MAPKTLDELMDMMRDQELEFVEEAERFAREATPEQKAARRRETIDWLMSPGRRDPVAANGD